jgi:hypothetical protein
VINGSGMSSKTKNTAAQSKIIPKIILFGINLNKNKFAENKKPGVLRRNFTPGQ